MMEVGVAIIGGGPAGVGAAVELAKRGEKSVMLIERSHQIGGVPAHYRTKAKGVPTFLVPHRGKVVFGDQYAAMLAAQLDQTATTVWLESQVVACDPAKGAVQVVSAQHGEVELSAQRVIFATGARDQTMAERGGIAGARPAGVYQSMQLIDLVDGQGDLPGRRPLIIGSGLIAYSIAAKLAAGGVGDITMTDRAPRPQCSLPARLYFRRWVKPQWRGGVSNIEIIGGARVQGASLDGQMVECDTIVLCPQLAPNNELFLAADARIAGNAVGGFHGAHWCYRHGRRVAGMS